MTEDLPARDMRASDAERERVADVLKDAVSEGRLGLEEFQERLDSAYRARTRGELLPLVRDLPAVADEGPASGPESAPALRGPWKDRIGGTATSRWGIALLGGFGRKGHWTAPRVFTGIAVMGGGELDLREARFEQQVVEIRCFVFMGGINVIVPPEVELEVRGIGIMGGFDADAGGTGVPGAPRVVVTGVAVWGGVTSERKPTRAEKKRLRDERKTRKADGDRTAPSSHLPHQRWHGSE